jgi:hypothetical protein
MWQSITVRNYTQENAADHTNYHTIRVDPGRALISGVVSQTQPTLAWVNLVSAGEVLHVRA